MNSSYFFTLFFHARIPYNLPLPFEKIKTGLLKRIFAHRQTRFISC